MNPIALLYDDDAYVEMRQRVHPSKTARPLGLMGRQVAGRGFLDAYLAHGAWEELVALVRDCAAADSLLGFCQAHPSSRARPRRLRMVEESRFYQSFFPDPPARLLHIPCPPSSRYAWARQRGGPGNFALCGVTHTLCSASVVAQIAEMVTAPFEPFDALICTSSAVVAMVRAVAENYAAYLQERHGGEPRLRPRLELIPLGVDTQRFHPPTAEERASQRQALGIGPDEVTVLFVGRLSHHAKAHPFPMFRGLGEAAHRSGRSVRLLLSGWAANQAVHDSFLEGARSFAPDVRVTVVDGMDPTMRFRVWQAADIFTTLVDNIQETFGLVVIEAMASGLPVVVSDWDGYRDLVIDGETGLLVPTSMVTDAQAELTTRLLLGELNYDHFLAESSQTVSVDVDAASRALGRLIDDAPLRQRLGDAGRRRAVEHFAWPTIIQRYEDLWKQQEAERLRFVTRRDTRPMRFVTPAIYPELDHTFAGYPSRTLQGGDNLVASPDADAWLDRFLTMPLTNHGGSRRSNDAALLRVLLAEASVPCPITRLDALLSKAGTSFRDGRATLAWMLKYGLLRVAADQDFPPDEP